jgi:hypothetical protein
MSTIAVILDKYAEKMNELESIQRKIKSAVPELIDAEAQLTKEVDAIKAEVKDKAKFIPASQAHTLVGKFFQLVWKPTSDKWDGEKIEAWVQTACLTPEQTAGLMACKSKGQATWAVCKKGKGK